jgi:hypothetical protein
MKARSLTIGKEQLTEIVLRLAKSGKLDDGSILVPFKIGERRVMFLTSRKTAKKALFNVDNTK